MFKTAGRGIPKVEYEMQVCYSARVLLRLVYRSLCSEREKGKSLLGGGWGFVRFPVPRSSRESGKNLLEMSRSRALVAVAPTRVGRWTVRPGWGRRLMLAASVRQRWGLRVRLWVGRTTVRTRRPVDAQTRRRRVRVRRVGLVPAWMRS